MNNLTDATNWLKSISVRFRPKSENITQELSDLVKIYTALSEIERAAFQSSIADVATKKLLPLSAFCSELAIETNDPDWIKVAVLLHVIEDFRTDYRENIRFLILIAYSANAINYDHNKIINDVFCIASTRAKNYLCDFINREPELNELGKFGIKFSVIDGQPRFISA